MRQRTHFPMDDRRKDRDIFWFSKQVDQPLKGGERRQRDLPGRLITKNKE
jgi:hypothetical protein